MNSYKEKEGFNLRVFGQEWRVLWKKCSNLGCNLWSAAALYNVLLGN
jgi:hypothetical protein